MTCVSWSTLSCRQVLARHLTALGHEATHVADVGMLSARDPDIWKHAGAIGAVLITKDEDFVTMRAFHPDGPPIIWVRLGNTTNNALLAHFVSMLPMIAAALERGEAIVVISER